MSSIVLTLAAAAAAAAAVAVAVAIFVFGVVVGVKFTRAAARVDQLINLDDLAVADATRRWQAAEIEADDLRGELHDANQQLRAPATQRSVA